MTARVRSPGAITSGGRIMTPSTRAALAGHQQTRPPARPSWLRQTACICSAMWMGKHLEVGEGPRGSLQAVPAVLVLDGVGAVQGAVQHEQLAGTCSTYRAAMQMLNPSTQHPLNHPTPG